MTYDEDRRLAEDKQDKIRKQARIEEERKAKVTKLLSKLKAAESLLDGSSGHLPSFIEAQKANSSRNDALQALAEIVTSEERKTLKKQ